MASRPHPTPPPSFAPTNTEPTVDVINDVILPPVASINRTDMSPNQLFALDYDLCQGTPHVIDNSINKGRGNRGAGAMPSPLRKKKPPSASPQRRSILTAAAASFAVAATGGVAGVHGNDSSPTSTITNIYL